jgi:hypothetical protein
LTHLWQRFLLASALIVGLAIGVAATVFGYSNLATVDVRWSVFHLHGVPLWTVAVVPITLLLVAGTVYHWIDGLHHFSEHMRHRHRVHELEGEVARLRAHLDQVLEMPRGEALPSGGGTKIALPAADVASTDAAMNGVESDSAEAKPSKSSGDRRKRARLATEPTSGTETPAAHSNGAETEPAPEPALPAQEA